MDRYQDDGELDAALSDRDEYLNPAEALKEAWALLDSIVGGDKLFDPGTDDERESRRVLDAQYEALFTRVNAIEAWGEKVDQAEQVAVGQVRGSYSANQNCVCCQGKGYPGHRYGVDLVDGAGEVVDHQAVVHRAIRDLPEGTRVEVVVITTPAPEVKP